MNEKLLNSKKLDLQVVRYPWAIFILVAFFALMSPLLGLESLNSVTAKLSAPFFSLALMTIGCLFLHFSRKTSSKIIAALIALIFGYLILVKYLIANQVFDIFGVMAVVILVYCSVITLFGIAIPKYVTPANFPISAVKEPL